MKDPNVQHQEDLDRIEDEDWAADEAERRTIDDERFGTPPPAPDKDEWTSIPLDYIGLRRRLTRKSDLWLAFWIVPNGGSQ